MSILFFIAAGFYTLASVAFMIHIFGRSKPAIRGARWSLILALIVQMAMIGALCLQKKNPLQDIRGALGLSAWLLGTGYLLTTVRSRLSIMGAFVAPLALMLLLISRLTPPGSIMAPGLERITPFLGHLHIGLSALGVMAFGLAAAVAILYLVQETALKGKRPGFFYRWSPPLKSLDDVSRRLILLGFPVFTLALISGIIWAIRLPIHEGFRLKHLISAVTWVIFGALILARAKVGLRGKQAAILTVIGFLTTVVILLLYMSRRLMGA